MYSDAFDYAAPATLDEALALLGEHGANAKLLAGGQSLIPLLKLRQARTPFVIDISRMPGLNYIAQVGDELRIGALTRHADLASSAMLKERYPLISAAGPQIADPLVRNLGTIGGALAYADPSGDWGAVMLALGAHVVVRSVGGERVIPITDFLRGAYSTALEPNELITEVRVPEPQGTPGSAYLKIKPKIGAWATVAVAVHFELENGTIARPGISLTAVGPANIKAAAAEAALAGREPSDDVFNEAAQLAAQAAQPTADTRGGEAYKRDMVRVLALRGLNAARSMAQQLVEA